MGLCGDYARSRYLLTIQLNDNDPLAAGAAVFELGLVPDFELFADPAHVQTRTGRNIGHMRVLSATERPERQRVIELGLTDSRFRQRLAEFLVRTGLEDVRAWTRRIVVDRENWNLAFQHWPLRENSPPRRCASSSATLICRGPVTRPSTRTIPSCGT